MLMCKSLSDGAGVGSMKDAGLKESWRAARAWHRERPGAALGKHTASVAVGPPDWGGVTERG